jgi:hypothetical protein
MGSCTAASATSTMWTPVPGQGPLHVPTYAKSPWDQCVRQSRNGEAMARPTMSYAESAFCRSAPWRVFTRRVVMPWALRGETLRGDALEIGAGSGATAEQLLDLLPQLRLTVSDFDPAMVGGAAERLARFGDRAVTCHPLPGWPRPARQRVPRRGRPGAT